MMGETLIPTAFPVVVVHTPSIAAADPWSNIDVESTASAPPPPSAPPPVSDRSKRQLLIPVLLTILLLCVVAVAWISTRPTQGPTSTEVVGVEETKQEPKRPALLRGDLTKSQIDSSRLEWSKWYGVPLEYSEDLGNGVKLEMVFVPPGTYWMGSPEGEQDRFTSETQHEVTISEGFYIGKYEVTQEQYEALMGTNPSYFQKGKDGADKVKDLDTKKFPVETVSWDDTQKFMTKLNAKSENNKNKRLYRLPREGEWEYICRGGQCSKHTLPFQFAEPQKSLSSTEANFNGNQPYRGAAQGPYLERTTKVGAYQKPNRFGIHDMHGNVYEWCEDWYDEKYYATSPKADPTGAEKGVFRVLRGGDWNSDGGSCRASDRYWSGPSNRSRFIGFRVLAPSSRKRE